MAASNMSIEDELRRLEGDGTFGTIVELPFEGVCDLFKQYAADMERDKIDSEAEDEVDLHVAEVRKIQRIVEKVYYLGCYLNGGVWMAGSLHDTEEQALNEMDTFTPEKVRVVKISLPIELIGPQVKLV